VLPGTDLVGAMQADIARAEAMAFAIEAVLNHHQEELAQSGVEVTPGLVQVLLRHTFDASICRVGGQRNSGLFEPVAECFGMNAEQASGARLVALGAVQHALNKFFLEFVHGFVKKDSAIHHLPDQIFQLIFHDRTLHTKINCGRTRRTGCLVQFSSR